MGFGFWVLGLGGLLFFRCLTLWSLCRGNHALSLLEPACPNCKDECQEENLKEEPALTGKREPQDTEALLQFFCKICPVKWHRPSAWRKNAFEAGVRFLLHTSSFMSCSISSSCSLSSFAGVPWSSYTADKNLHMVVLLHKPLRPTHLWHEPRQRTSASLPRSRA